QAPVAGTRTKLGREVTASRGNDEAEPRCNTAGVELKPVITKRQPRWQCHGDPLYLSAGGCCQSTGALLPAFEAAHPGDFSRAIWKVKHKLGMRCLGVDDVDRTQPQWRVPLSLGQLAPSDCRVGRKTEGGDQRQQRLVGHLVRATKSIRVMGLDTNETSELFDRGAVAHVTAEPGARRKKVALRGEPGSASRS